MFALARFSGFCILWLFSCCGFFHFQVTSYQMSTLARRVAAKSLCAFTRHTLSISCRAKHSRFLSSLSDLEIGHQEHKQLVTAPLVASVSIDPEIIGCMHMKSNHRKTRILFSPKSTLTIRVLRRAIENKFFALTGQDYKLRYRLSRCAEDALKQMRSDVDVAEAVQGCAELHSSMQLFVEVNPGVFPAVADPANSAADSQFTVASEVHGEGSRGVVHKKKLHPSVLAMRAALLDPADSDSYVMVSFYGFRCIDDPREFSYELERLWKPFQALGRVYVAHEGVNAQMAVPSNVLRYFEEATRSMPVFAKMRLNTDDLISRAQYEQRKPFRALHVRPRKQILADGFDSDDLLSNTVMPTPSTLTTELDWTQAGQEMHPLEWHRRLSRRSTVAPTGIADSTELVTSVTDRPPLVLDCRNSYESDVGLFDGAVPLNTTFFRESWPVLEELLKDTPKDAPVLTYCTGGIRCVKVNAYLQQKMGFTNTHRLAGGIIAYNRELDALRKLLEEGQAENTMPLESTYKGVNYVFDERIGARVTEDVLTSCEQCAASCDKFTNCLSYPCNVRFIQCSKCRTNYGGCCSKACQTLYSQSMSTERGATASTAPSLNGILSRKAQHISRNLKVAPMSPSTTAHTRATAPASQVMPKLEHAYTSAAAVTGEATSGTVEMMEALAMYCERHSTEEPALLQVLRAETLARYAHSPGAARMLCDPLQGQLLSMLVSLSRAEHVLELGAFTGYSAICLAQGMDNDNSVAVSQSRRVISCEPDPVARGIARKHVQLGGLQDRVDIRDSKAADLLKSLQAESATAPFDLVFLDADKKQYTQYLHTLMGDDRQESGEPGRQMLRDGALIIVDNTLWKGLVLEVEAEALLPRDGKTAGTNGSAHAAEAVSPRMRVLAQSLHAFNAHVAAEPRLKQVMLPIRDGLTVIQYRAL